MVKRLFTLFLVECHLNKSVEAYFSENTTSNLNDICFGNNHSVMHQAEYPIWMWRVKIFIVVMLILMFI